MVTKKKSTGEKEEKSRVKVDKLQINRETVKDLTSGEQKKIQGGAGTRYDSLLATNCKTGC